MQRASAILIVSALTAVADGVSAQPAALIPAASPTAAAAPLSEVVVTAQRREQSVQALGIAVSVLSGQQLSLRGVTDVVALQYQTPGLQITPAFGTGQPNYRLRGVGFDDYASNNSSPVGVSIDEVAFPFPIQTTGQIFDVARVEVLRGPQGTLYGRNTTGGAINFISNRPTKDFAAGVDAEYGSYDYGKVEGYVSGPLSDTVRVRLSGIDEQGGGFQHDRTTGEEIGDLDRYALRGQLQWDVTPKLDVLVEASYGRDQSDGAGLYRFDTLGGAPAVVDRDHTGWGASPAFASLLGIQPDTKPFRDNENDGVDLHVAYDFGFAKLTSITAYHTLTRREYEDFDASSAADADEYFHSRANVFSQELRLSSESTGALKWVGGLYYSKEDLREVFLSDFVDYPHLQLIADTRYVQHAFTVAGFGQVDWAVTDRLSITAGLRVERERRSLDEFSTVGVGIGAFSALPAESTAYSRLSGKAEVDYRLLGHGLLYASGSRGVKSGGFTAYNTTNVGQLAPFKPESLWAYEVGAKSQFLNDTVRLNGDAFYYDYRDEQLQGAVYDAFSHGPIGKIVNVARSHIYGVEVELQWKPLPELEIDQGASLTRGEFDDYSGLDVGASNAAGAAVYDRRDGQDLGFPKWSLNGSATWTQPVAGDYELIGEVDYAYRDKTSPVLLGPTFDVRSYWLSNATLTFRPARGPWSLGLWARNLTGTRYDYTRNFFLPGIDIAAPGAPATFGGRVSYRY